MLTLFISPLPDSRTTTKPPPEVPSTSTRSSSACMDSILDFNSAACFIRPRKSAIVCSSPASKIVLETVIAIEGRIIISRLGGAVAGAAHRHVGIDLANVNDLRAGKARQHRLHQRIGAHANLELGLLGVLARLDGRQSFLG